uniref:AntA domain-containing protein n=2 Tax=cellular organisms TaxID=131567 RepID=T1I4I9_RHOPR
MTNQLIPVFNGTISNEATLLCDARKLHEFLDVRRDFSTWIKNRVTEYGFIENADYILVHQSGGIKNTRGGDRRSKDYHLTLNTAKEL